MNIISKVSTGKASLFTSYWLICFPIGFLINLADKTGEGRAAASHAADPFPLVAIWRLEMCVQCQVSILGLYRERADNSQRSDRRCVVLCQLCQRDP